MGSRQHDVAGWQGPGIVNGAKQWLLLSISLLSLACAHAAPGAAGAEGSQADVGPEPAEALDERLDELLEKTLVPDAYGEQSNCLYVRAYRRAKVLNDRVLLFEGVGRYWLNRLKRKCVGLTRDMVLTMDHKGLSVCAADRAQGRVRISGPPVVSATCSLGPFEEIDEVHARALIETLR